MNRIAILFLFFAGECLAHPGHGAASIHVHGWDWAYLALALGIAAVTAIAIRRWK